MDNIRLIKMKKKEIFKAWLLQKKGFIDTLKRYRDYKTSPVMETFIGFYKKFNNKSADHYWVISGNKIAGAVCLVTRADCMWVANFYILPKFRNQGIGQEALLFAENLYPDAKIWRLDTIFEEKNNIHLYEKLGYRQYGEKQTINHRMSLVKFEKTLSKN